MDYELLRGTSESSFDVGLGTLGSPKTYEILRTVNAVGLGVDALATSVAYFHYATPGATGAPTIMTAQNAATTGGALTLASGSGGTANGALGLFPGGATGFSITKTIALALSLTAGSTMTSVDYGQTITVAATGAPTALRAQNAATTGGALTLASGNGGTTGGIASVVSGTGSVQANAGSIDFRPGNISTAVPGAGAASLTRILGTGQLLVGRPTPVASATHLIRSFNAVGGLIFPLAIKDGGNAGNTAFTGIQFLDVNTTERFRVAQAGANRLDIQTSNMTMGLNCGADPSSCFLASPAGATGNLAILGVNSAGLPSFNTGQRVLAIHQAQTDPTSPAPANFGYLYLATATGALTFRGSGGTLTTIAPP